MKHKLQTDLLFDNTDDNILSDSNKSNELSLVMKSGAKIVVKINISAKNFLTMWQLSKANLKIMVNADHIIYINKRDVDYFSIIEI